MVKESRKLWSITFWASWGWFEGPIAPGRQCLELFILKLSRRVYNYPSYHPDLLANFTDTNDPRAQFETRQRRLTWISELLHLLLLLLTIPPSSGLDSANSGLLLIHRARWTQPKLIAQCLFLEFARITKGPFEFLATRNSQLQKSRSLWLQRKLSLSATDKKSRRKSKYQILLSW